MIRTRITTLLSVPTLALASAIILAPSANADMGDIAIAVSAGSNHHQVDPGLRYKVTANVLGIPIELIG